jgi:hypothetical protein
MNGTWARIASRTRLLTLAVTFTLALGGCVGEAEDEAPPVTASAASPDTPASAPAAPSAASGVRAVTTTVVDPSVAQEEGQSGGGMPEGSDPEPSPWRPNPPAPLQNP